MHAASRHGTASLTSHAKDELPTQVAVHFSCRHFDKFNPLPTPQLSLTICCCRVVKNICLYEIQVRDLSASSSLSRLANILSTGSFDEDLKKLRMQQLDFDAKRITSQSDEKSAEHKMENKKYKVLEKLLLDQKRMIKSIVEETINGKKDEGKN